MVKLYHPDFCQNSDVLSVDTWERGDEMNRSGGDDWCLGVENENEKCKGVSN